MTTTNLGEPHMPQILSNQHISPMTTPIDSTRVGTVVSADPVASINRTTDSFTHSSGIRTLGHTAVAALRIASGGVTLRAPDGMVIDGSAINRPTDIPQTRAERIKAGMKAEVPQRVQQGPTCGLYALGMVMDFWHQADKTNPTVLVSDKDIGGKGRNYNDEPTSD